MRPARSLAANVLLVANDASEASLAIAKHYAEVRHIPADQVLHLKVPPADVISRVDFDQQIHGPISTWLSAHGAQDRILYIVLTKDVPLRISGTTGRTGTVASVDSELTLLYRRMTGTAVLPNGPIPNPYFAGASLDQAKPFTHDAFDIFLVTRLDGFTVADVIGLIDRGAAPRTEGRILLDESPTRPDPRNQWLEAAAARLRATGNGERVVLDDTARALQREAGVLGYYSWGSNRSRDHVQGPGALLRARRARRDLQQHGRADVHRAPCAHGSHERSAEPTPARWNRWRGTWFGPAPRGLRRTSPSRM